MRASSETPHHGGTDHGRSRAIPDAAVEVIPGKLYGLGGRVWLDGRVSWAPDEQAYQPINCYLLLGEDPILVDTGLPAHEREVIGQLRSVLPNNRSTAVFLSRAEWDCIGNLGAIM